MTPPSGEGQQQTSGRSPRQAVNEADIVGRDDIEALLRDFYGRAFDDALLGPVFIDIAQMNLDEHLPVMCDFWETALFHAGLYRGNALAPHQVLHHQAQLTPRHFRRWLALWRATVHERHHGPKAELADLQATRIAAAMSRRITGQPLPHDGEDDPPEQSVVDVAHHTQRWHCDSWPSGPASRVGHSWVSEQR